MGTERRSVPRVVLVVVMVVAVVGTWVVAAPPAAAAAPAFTDSFDAAVDRDPTYGLNDSLARRQQGDHRGVTYSRTSGVWYDAPAPRPWYSQVNHSGQPGALSFWLGHSAVRMDAPVLAGSDGAVTVTTTVDPITGETGSGQWASLVLTADRSNSGYVTNPQVDLGVIVRSNGGITVFHGGAIVGQDNTTPASDGRFTVSATARPGSRDVKVTVNGETVTAQLARAFPAEPSLFLGAYLDDNSAITAFHDLSVSDVNMTGLVAPPGSGTRELGYFAARITPNLGNRLPEVAGRSTLNHVNISDFDRYAPEVLDDCAPNSCAVYTGWEFFTGCDGAGSPNCRLYDNYQARWQRLADQVRPKLDRVAAFYLLDEPYHRGAQPADVATAARTIKATFPDAKVMLVEAAYKVATIQVPAEVDWVGFDQYCRPVNQVEQTLRTLEQRTLAKQRLFVFPQAAPLAACGNTAGYRTDAELAKLQRDYLALAERHPRVLGLMTFGLWVEGTNASALPKTIDAHERIAARLIAR